MRVVVAGGTGFLGTHLCRGALERGFAVTSLSSTPPSARRELKGVEYVTVDLSSSRPVLEFQPNLIFNAAGYVDHPADEIHEAALLNQHFSIIQNLSRIRPAPGARFIHLGSGDEYNEAFDPVSENMPADGCGSYGRVKAASTRFAMDCAAQAGYSVTVLRLFLVYGPLQAENRLLPQLLRGLNAGKRVPLSSGRQIRDFLYVDDLVDATYASAQATSTSGRILNISSGIPVAVRDVARLVHEMIGAGDLGFGELPDSRVQAKTLVGDSHLIRSLTNWEPKIGLHEGLSRTIESFRPSAN